MHIGRVRERRLLVAGQRDQARALALEMRHQRNKLVGLARIRQEQHDVFGGDHAEVPVTRLGGMHEERRCSGRRERCRDLASDMPGLTDAGHDDATATFEQRPRRREERGAQPL